MLFMLAAWGAIFMAVPLVNALETQRGGSLAQAGRSASAGSSSPAAAQSQPQPVQSRYATFEQCDRNKDGFLDKSEAASVPGLSANFERSDLNKDGRLDKVEFARALSQLDARR